MSDAHLQRVQEYIRLRSTLGADPATIVQLFAPTGMVVDAEGHEHRGEALLKYFQAEVPTVVRVDPPQAQADGRITCQFVVRKYFLNWNITATFEFASSLLIQKVTIRRN